MLITSQKLINLSIVGKSMVWLAQLAQEARDGDCLLVEKGRCFAWQMLVEVAKELCNVKEWNDM